MPLQDEKIHEIMEYCMRDLPQEFSWYIDQFSFIDDEALRKQLAVEFYSSRYIYKLQEALNVTDMELHAHAKFQIIQYASLYEAVINYLLSILKDEDRVKKLYYYRSLKAMSALSALTEITYEGEKAYIAVYKDSRTPLSSIKFSDKVDVLMELGAIDESYGEEIKTFYQTRNSIHIETAVKRSTEYHLELARLAYYRMLPFIDRMKTFFEKLNKN